MYRRLWADCIVYMKRKQPLGLEWPAGSMIYMSLAMSTNLIVCVTIHEKHFFKRTLYSVKPFANASYANYAVEFMVIYAGPCLLLNYIFIFHRKRYVSILKKYPAADGKLFEGYFIASMLLPIMLIWTGLLFFRTTPLF